MPPDTPRIRRRFVDLPHGQVHLRTAQPETATGAPPLVMLHASPGSSRQIEPLIARLARGRAVYAPDCPGNGDSEPVEAEVPEIDGLADVLLDAIDRLVPGDGPVDLYGSHTGARLACSIALHHPARVRRVILDGFGIYSADERDEILAVYAPEQAPDALGRHLMWGWHFARDQWIWFPWFDKRDERRVTLDLPSPTFLHDLFVEIMKAVGTYHRSYRAAFRYDMRRAVPALGQPTLICAQRTDMIHAMLPRMAELLPGAPTALTPGTATDADAEETAGVLAAFLDGAEPA